MIDLNGIEIVQGHFPDNTLLIKAPTLNKELTLTWHYENDGELFTIICLRKHYWEKKMILNLPYCPHARMDRVKNNEDVFTLKYFTEIINNLNFDKVIVNDPHSNVAHALINNIETNKNDIKENVISAISNIAVLEANNGGIENNLVMFYPDEGAMKRYSELFNIPYAFGIKKRDWNTGKINGLTIVNSELIKDKNVLIVDDICSKGGTFLHSADALNSIGVKNIYLYVTHCEHSVFDGNLFPSKLIKKMFTTDSIFKKTWETDEIMIVNNNGKTEVV